MGDVLILFRNSKKLKLFDSQLNKNKILHEKESYKPFYNYTLKMVNINKIMFFILVYSFLF